MATVNSCKYCLTSVIAVLAVCSDISLWKEQQDCDEVEKWRLKPAGEIKCEYESCSRWHDSVLSTSDLTSLLYLQYVPFE